MCGTVEYLAPEVADSREYDFAVDMWCVGVLAYEMLTGGSPFFDERGEGAILERIREGAVAYPRERFGPSQRAAKDFIRRLLVVEPHRRMSATEVLRHPWIVMHTGPYSPQPGVVGGAQQQGQR